MTKISNYLENAWLGHIFDNNAYTSPGTSIYVALFTAAPSDAGGGTEVSGGSYARVQVTAWDAPSGGATANTNAITFPTATAAWGTVTHVGIFDASTVGNLLFWGALDSSIVVADTDVVEWAAGALDIDLTGSDYMMGKLIDHTLRNTTFTSPLTTVIHCALMTATPNDTGGGTEVSGGSYARQQVGTWTITGTTATDNDGTITWPTATASWGDVTHYAIYDAITVGNLWCYGAFPTTKTINNGDDFSQAAGQVVITLD